MRIAATFAAQPSIESWMAYGDGRPTGSWIRRSRDGHIAGIESWSASGERTTPGSQDSGKKARSPPRLPQRPSRRVVIDPLPYRRAFVSICKPKKPTSGNGIRRIRTASSMRIRCGSELLKSTYRVDPRVRQPLVYAAAEAAAKPLGPGRVPITLYQAQNPAGLNASLAFVPDEAAYCAARSRGPPKLLEPYELRGAAGPRAQPPSGPVARLKRVSTDRPGSDHGGADQ